LPGIAYRSSACQLEFRPHRAVLACRLSNTIDAGFCLAPLDEALAQRADLILARQEKGESLWQLGRKEEAISVWSDAVQRNARLVLANNQLAGAERSFGRFEEAIAHERQADQFTPDNPLYHWMIGLRLQNLGMKELAEKHFQRAIQIDPGYQGRPK
jgi:tetratricopeptide (TPR) repeat protein